MAKGLHAAIKASGVAREMTMPFIARAARMGDECTILSLLPAVTKLKLPPDRFAHEFVGALQTWKRRFPSKLRKLKSIVLKWATKCSYPENLDAIFSDL